MVCYVLQEKCNILQEFCICNSLTWKSISTVACYALSNSNKILLRPSDQRVVHSLLLYFLVRFECSKSPLSLQLDLFIKLSIFNCHPI